ncbi:MAG: carbon-nitrogen hydrolase family protein [Burkholderiales bacterium]|nr:carbon-nitrogen hydrolase family protein [Burkholderiales bacterium]
MKTIPRIAIAQIAMHWSTAENLAAILRAMELASSRGAALCGFSELAVTGFHREIAREATPEQVLPAIRELQTRCAQLSLGIAVGAPTFGTDGARYNSHLLIDESGATRAVVSKQGLTDPEATFFARGASRPTARLQGLNCSAVICREVSDLELVASQLQPGVADLVFVPGALRQDPEKPRTDPPEYVRDIQRLAAATTCFVVQTNWPNALNRPEESVDGGGSTVAAPSGEVLFRLPPQAAGVGVFNLGDRHFEWHPQ